MISEFAKAVGIPELLILDGGRKREFVDARHLYWKLLHDKRGFTLEKIARLNGRTHPTVLHGINKVNYMLEAGERTICEMWEKVKNITI